MTKVIQQHFQTVDPIFFTATASLPFPIIQQSTRMFYDLIESIIGQQLSSKAANTIIQRFYALYPVLPSAQIIIDTPEHVFRNVGMSWNKASYVKNVALAVESRSLDLDSLPLKEDREVIKLLTSIKGIGTWTSEMFLMFSLGRPDVFSFGDLGLKRAIQHLYGLKDEPTKEMLVQISNRWKPYRTFASMLLWRYIDGMNRK